ncbi:MAG TPA: hypothetical protein VFT79_07300 [Solirubrobacterales bacterium]|nr:hypothetical protein [Solirubrobacterales bacterium]
MCDQGEELSFTLAKVLITGGMNVALPGVGSLLSIGFSRFKGSRKDFEKAVNGELLAAAREAQPRHKDGVVAQIRRGLSRSRLREGSALKKFSGAKSLTESGEQNREPGLADEPSLSTGGTTPSALGLEQLELASQRGFVPGCWQDEFAMFLKAAAREGLAEPDRRSGWRSLIGIEDGPDPTGPELASWAKQVTGVFALRMEMNPQLKPVASALRTSERDAIQRALLWRLDQQRRSLQLMAYALIALLAALGIEADVLLD